MKLTTAFKLVLLSLSIIFCSALIHAQVKAIKAGKLLDPETGTITANQIILVEGQDKSVTFVMKNGSVFKANK